MSEYEHQEIADLTPEQVSRVFNLIGAAIDGLSDVDVAERIAYCETHDARGVRMYRDSDDDVVELRALLTGEPALQMRATPGYGAQVEMWMLGSSLFGAQLAAMIGMPYAFASHFAPDHLDAALALYRKEFRPSPWLDRPHAMAAMTVIAADSDEEAVLLASSLDQGFVALRSGTPGRLKPPVPGYRKSLPPQMLAMLEHMRSTYSSYLARTPSGPVLFVGDTCHTAWGWDHGVEPGEFTRDRPKNAVSLARLRELVRNHPKVRVRLGHQHMTGGVAHLEAGL